MSDNLDNAAASVSELFVEQAWRLRTAGVDRDDVIVGQLAAAIQEVGREFGPAAAKQWLLDTANAIEVEPALALPLDINRTMGTA